MLLQATAYIKEEMESLDDEEFNEDDLLDERMDGH